MNHYEITNEMHQKEIKRLEPKFNTVVNNIKDISAKCNTLNDLVFCTRKGIKTRQENEPYNSFLIHYYILNIEVYDFNNKKLPNLEIEVVRNGKDHSYDVATDFILVYFNDSPHPLRKKISKSSLISYYQSSHNV